MKLDNSVLFTQYQSIASNGGSYQNPSLGALTTFSINELMENYKITGGLQIPANFPIPATTYFLQYQNFTHRLDWGVAFLRTMNKGKEVVGYEKQ